MSRDYHLYVDAPIASAIWRELADFYGLHIFISDLGNPLHIDETGDIDYWLSSQPGPDEARELAKNNPPPPPKIATYAFTTHNDQALVPFLRHVADRTGSLLHDLQTHHWYPENPHQPPMAAAPAPAQSSMRRSVINQIRWVLAFCVWIIGGFLLLGGLAYIFADIPDAPGPRWIWGGLAALLSIPLFPLGVKALPEVADEAPTHTKEPTWVIPWNADGELKPQPDPAWISQCLARWDKQLPINPTPYFTRDHIGDLSLNVFNLGNASFPTGIVMAGDTYTSLGFPDHRGYWPAIPPGYYPAHVAVGVYDEGSNPRAIALRILVSQAPTCRFVNPIPVGTPITNESEHVTYCMDVDASTASISDLEVSRAVGIYKRQELARNYKWNLHDDHLEYIEAEARRIRPELQGEAYLWTIPGTPFWVPVVSSGWGDGSYPVYFGLDAYNRVTQVVAQFIQV